MSACEAEVASVLQTWYEGESTHLWRDISGHFHKVGSTKGFDQGCPLAAAAFAIGQRSVLDPFLQQLLQLDPNAKLFSYLDDTYLVIAKEVAARTLAALEQAFEPLGLKLNPTKTKLWSPSGRDGLPPQLYPHYTDALPVLGGELTTSEGHRDGALVHLGGHANGLEEVTERLREVWTALTKLSKAGLTRQAVAALLRNYAGPASQFVLQLEQPSDAQVLAYDNLLTSIWETLADRSFSDAAKQRLGLSTKLGGCGAQFAETRRHAAFWSMSCSTLEEVVAGTRFSTVADFLEVVPLLAAKLEAARQGLAQQGLAFNDGAALANAVRSSLRQGMLVQMIQKKTRDTLTCSLCPERAAALRGAGGPGSAGFLQFPSEAATSMEDCWWSVALRQRLGLARAEASERELATVSDRCCCRAASTGNICNGLLDEDGFHAITEQSGGGVVVRHNRLARVVGSLVKRWRLQEPLYEQRVPTWDRANRRSTLANTVEHAVLDIEFTDTNGRCWIDVSVRHPAAGDASALRAASRKDGEASRRAERAKHERYPGPQLVPFVVETPGRIGAEARFWLLSQVRALPDDAQSAELARAYKAISCAVQADVAKQLRRAAGML